jgi:magnesium-transporting ATPase (P-type)
MNQKLKERPLTSLFNRNKTPKEAKKQIRLKLRGVDVWSAVKVGFLISIALVVGAWLIWSVLANSGIFSSIGSLLGSVLGDSSNVNLENDFSFSNVMTTATTLALLNVVLTTALWAVWAVIFNLISKLVGGLSLTFTNN